MIVNVGHPEGQDDLEKALSATMGAVFPHVARDPIEPTNTLVLASRRAPSAQRLTDAVPNAAGARCGHWPYDARRAQPPWAAAPCTPTTALPWNG